MDRLVCGDVGFGKTEVALRSAFVAAMSGRQVAVIAPTTLLCRQHYETFRARFAGLPIRIGQLSRLATAKETKETKAGLADGNVDIVIGTHALLAKTVSFKNLGLLIVDEEQHFGVKHKERLKELKAEVHVLTLSATPIPRTLQMALTGLRELSIIATPPVDRLAVRTFVTPFDPLVLREALLREHYRGGQSFVVCPRVADLPEMEQFLKDQVPEVTFRTAHGRMAAGELDDVMTAFYEGQFDVLLSTTIIESGLDIPTANTMVVHRADMFGLAQLYQLRGRIGRSKVRGYAYLTVPANRSMTKTAERRLKVLQSLDELGAGFSLASHDLDIRGAGNLLGEEQSGHIREVGAELYQQMLEDAVSAARAAGGADVRPRDEWSPQINLGLAVLIPETYIADLDVRMGLYRRLAHVEDAAELDGLVAEMIDRFGPLPKEVEALTRIMGIKLASLKARIERIDAGPKGATLTFRENRFPDPAALVQFISSQRGTAKLRPDHKLVLKRDWENDRQRLEGVDYIVKALAKIATKAQTVTAQK
jgi:transcription-repair coupling factor (superfamily II helicase)